MNSFFLVFVNFSLVAKDVTATLEQMGLGDPLIAASEQDALSKLAALEQGMQVRLAVIQATPAVFAASALRNTLEMLGTKVVLLNDGIPRDNAGSPYPVLSLPFFTEDLEALVAQISDPPKATA
ncbi:hypothetical protein [Yoonia sp.]|uniref:hypothetical protein n=1 Tax=Yoonia sp. TaxID=2212373 RepID=UPI00391AACB3